MNTTAPLPAVRVADHHHMPTNSARRAESERVRYTTTQGRKVHNLRDETRRFPAQCVEVVVNMLTA
ncbi:hypothetical protein BC629DRAFT_1571942 [Irpex lacteus]|nr:hypothetical protein BC629DRAFT_1571942 [Irpex lacteus]